MDLSRRLLLALPFLGTPFPAGTSAPLRLEPVGDDTTAVIGPRGRRPLLLPSSKVRLAAGLPVGGQTVILVAILLEAGSAAIELAAFVHHSEDGIDLLALDVMNASGPDGSRLVTRAAGAGDRARLRLSRDCAIPRGPTRWERESFIDYLVWAAPCGLVDAPIRPTLPGTRQHALAGLRQRLARVAGAAPRSITPAMLEEAGIQAATFSLSVS